MEPEQGWLAKPCLLRSVGQPRQRAVCFRGVSERELEEAANGEQLKGGRQDTDRLRDREARLDRRPGGLDQAEVCVAADGRLGPFCPTLSVSSSSC